LTSSLIALAGGLVFQSYQLASRKRDKAVGAKP
jgi:hypothetical protein